MLIKCLSFAKKGSNIWHKNSPGYWTEAELDNLGMQVERKKAEEASGEVPSPHVLNHGQ